MHMSETGAEKKFLTKTKVWCKDSQSSKNYFSVELDQLIKGSLCGLRAAGADLGLRKGSDIPHFCFQSSFPFQQLNLSRQTLQI